MTPAEIIELETAPARRERRGPPGDFARFPERLSADELAEFFFFDQGDRGVIARRRRELNRLGFAVQLGTVRYLGRFLEDPSDVATSVVRWVARELEPGGSVGLAAYAGARRGGITRRRSAASTTTASSKSPTWSSSWCGGLEARAWVSAETHMALFDRAADQLVAAKVLLPGASVLWRLVGTVRQRAQERSWSLVASGLTGEERRRLLRS